MLPQHVADAKRSSAPDGWEPLSAASRTSPIAVVELSTGDVLINECAQESGSDISQGCRTPTSAGGAGAWPYDAMMSVGFVSSDVSVRMMRVGVCRKAHIPHDQGDWHMRAPGPQSHS